MRVIGNLHFPLAVALLVSALLFGGGQGTLGDTFCQLLALALIGLSLWRHAAVPDARLPPLAWLAALPLLLPLLQLLPIPQVLWLWPQERVDIAAELATAGVDPASRASLVPMATERALAWLLPLVAMFLAGLQLDLRRRTTLLATFVAIASVAVVLGLAQLAGGEGSALRFYRITNFNGAVGFFANSNHNAMFMAASLPFVVVGCGWWLSRRREAGASELLWAVAGLGLATLMIIGIAMTTSRAGVGLGMLGLLLALVAVLRFRRGGGARRWWPTVLGVGAVLAVQVVLLAVLQLALEGRALDERYRFTPITLEAAQAHAPLGTGLGGFRAAFETFDDVAPGDVYANHAHNDYAELWLEGGWLALLIALPLLAAFLRAAWLAWRPGAPKGEAAGRLVQQAASIAIALVLVHSLVDYPLRTSAHLALFGLMAACLARPASKALSPSP